VISGARDARILLGFALGGLPDDQLGLQKNELRRNRFSGFDQLQSEAPGFFTDGHGLLIDAGERNFQEFVVHDVAAADDGDIFRDAEPSVENGGNGAVGDGVVVAKNSVRARIELQQLFCCGVAGGVADFFHVLDVVNQFRIYSQSHFCERTLVAFHAAHHRAETAAADVRDALASDFGEVPSGECADLFIINADEMGRESSETAIDEDVWNAGFFHATKHFDGPLGGGDEEHVHAAGDELFDSLLFELGILFGRGGDQGIAGTLEGERDTPHDFREKGVKKLWDNETEQIRAASDQGARREVRAVIHFLDALEDAGFGFLTYVGMVAEGFGDGDHGDAEVPRDVFQSDSHRGFYHESGRGSRKGAGEGGARSEFTGISGDIAEIALTMERECSLIVAS
jgi:hypothetical protein